MMTFPSPLRQASPPSAMAEGGGRDDERIGLELRRIRKDNFGERGSLAKVAKEADVSIALLGAIERGDHSLVKVGQERIVRLAQAYGMSKEEFADLTGISIVSPVEGNSVRSYSAGSRGWRVPKQAPEPIPESLLEAAKIYGENVEFAGIREYRWQRWMADSPHKHRPSTPEEWLGFYMSVKDRFNPKEPKE